METHSGEFVWLYYRWVVRKRI